MTLTIKLKEADVERDKGIKVQREQFPLLNKHPTYSMTMEVQFLQGYELFI